MSDDDILVDLLDRLEIRPIRKPEGILERGNGDGDHAGGYDLTNPNLHHRVEAVYRPAPSSEPSRSDRSIDTGGSSAAISESFKQDGGSGPTATAITNQSAYEGQSF